MDSGTPAGVAMHAGGFELHAWVDESMHAVQPADGYGIYVLIAVVADPSSCDEMRERLRDLVPRGKAKLHWRDEDDDLRHEIARTVATLDITMKVVVGYGYKFAKQERARRNCMERLLFEVENLGVSCVTLESRTPSLNVKDQSHVAALRGRGAMKGIRFEFGLPSVEPMLWIPDAVAGATGAASTGRQVAYRATMQHVIEEIKIEVR